MSYKSLRSQATPFRKTSKVNLGAISGINLFTAKELQTEKFAQEIDGYFIRQEGRIETIPGLLSVYDTSDNEPIYFLSKFDDGIYVFAHGTSLKSYIVATDSVVTLSTGLTSGRTKGQGGRYGNFFYFCNGADFVWCYPPGLVLAYTSETSPFTEGQTITEAVSGATGTIDIVIDNGTTGLLFLSSITGTFTGGNTITDSFTGSATSVLTYGFTNTMPGEAIQAEVLHFFGGRMYLGRDTKIQWSSVDEGNDIPFITSGEWTPSGTPVSPESSSSSSKRQFGSIRAMSTLGGQVVVFFDDGKLGFRLDSVDAGTGLAQKIISDFEREDFGGEQGAISTAYGIFYLNEGGLWQMLSGGNTNQPFSENDNELSQVLGEELLGSLDLTNSSIVYDNKRDLVYFTAAEDSSINNVMFWYNPQNKAFGRLTNVFINRFIKDGTDIYVGSSVETNLLKLFEGNDNNGVNFFRKLEFEIPTQSLDTLFDLFSTTVKGFISGDSNITISYDIYDKFGIKTVDFLQFTLSSDTVNTNLLGFNSMGFSGAFGTFASDELVETRSEIHTPISEFSRIIMRITSEDSAPHELTWISVDIRAKGENITNQNLTVTN